MQYFPSKIGFFYLNAEKLFHFVGLYFYLIFHDIDSIKFIIAIDIFFNFPIIFIALILWISACGRKTGFHFLTVDI